MSSRNLKNMMKEIGRHLHRNPNTKFIVFGQEPIVIDNFLKRKYCELPTCRKLATHHFLVGYHSREPHSMCSRHKKEFSKLLRAQVKNKSKNDH